MSRYEARLNSLESLAQPELRPQVCIVFGDEDADAAVAKFRKARNWPNDDAHPVQVIRVRWGKSE